MVKKKKPKYVISAEFIVLAVLILVALLLRLWQVWRPDSYVFDEVYYAKYAQDIIARKPWIDVHPPLGDLLIALGIKTFGNNAFGWRVVPALIGTAMVPLGYAVAKKIFSGVYVALLTAFFIAFDGLFIVQSRSALLVIFVAFFVLLAYLLALYFFQTKNTKYLFFSSVAMGLALAVQWTAAPYWIILMCSAAYFARRDTGLFVQTLLIYIITPLLVYLISFLAISDRNYFDFLRYWHTRTWQFHSHLKGNHEFASRWYTWLYLFQPITYWQAKHANGDVAYVLALGNPIIWWSAIGGLIYSGYYFIKNKAKFLALPLISFLGYFLGWSIISREQFIYYILPALPFYFMLLAFTLTKLYKNHRKIVIGWIVVVIVTFLFFYPMYVARPIPFFYYKLTLWLPNWHNISLIK